MLNNYNFRALQMLKSDDEKFIFYNNLLLT